jgi:hypothetical protein
MVITVENVGDNRNHSETDMEEATLGFFLLIFFFLVVSGSGVYTQGLLLARQVLYH